jgi:HK97 family phage portal protein
MKRPQPITALRNWIIAGNRPVKGRGLVSRVAPTSDGYGSTGRRIPTLQANDQGYSLAYKAISDIFACVNLRAESIAELPVKVVKTGTEVEVPNNPWTNAINDAMDNGHQDLMYLMEYALSIWGETYVLKLLQDDKRTPGGLQWLNPQSVELVIENGYLVGFQYTGGDGDAKEFGRKDVGYYYYRDSDDDNVALSVIRAALDAANIKRNSQAFIEAFFANDATVGGIITGRSRSAAFGGSSTPLNEKDRAEIIEQWKQQNQGARKAFRTVRPRRLN